MTVSPSLINGLYCSKPIGSRSLESGKIKRTWTVKHLDVVHQPFECTLEPPLVIVRVVVVRADEQRHVACPWKRRTTLPMFSTVLFSVTFWPTTDQLTPCGLRKSFCGSVTTTATLPLLKVDARTGNGGVWLCVQNRKRWWVDQHWLVDDCDISILQELNRQVCIVQGKKRESYLRLLDDLAKQVPAQRPSPRQLVSMTVPSRRLQWLLRPTAKWRAFCSLRRLRSSGFGNDFFQHGMESLLMLGRKSSEPS